MSKWEYCEGCGVSPSPVGGIHHKLGCPYHTKQPPNCPMVGKEDALQYTPPDYPRTNQGYSDYDRGWDDAIYAVEKVLHFRIRRLKEFYYEEAKKVHEV